MQWSSVDSSGFRLESLSVDVVQDWFRVICVLLVLFIVRNLRQGPLHLVFFKFSRRVLGSVHALVALC